MVVVTLVLVVALAVVLVRQVRSTRRPSWRRRQVERSARRAHLPARPVSEGGEVPDTLLVRVGARLAGREVAATTGAIVGAAVALVLVLTGSELDRRGAVVSGGTGSTLFSVEFSLLPLVAVLLVLAGRSAGVLAASAREAVASPAAGDRRLARATSPALVDYVPRVETSVVRLLCVAPVVVVGLLALASLAVPGLTAPDAGLVVLAAVSAALWSVVELLCHRVLAQRQPAGSPLELAWDDVLRARALRDLVQLPLVLGAVVTTGLALAAPGRLLETGVAGWVATAAVLVALLALLAAVGALLVSALARPVEQYVRVRLWSDEPAATAGVQP